MKSLPRGRLLSLLLMAALPAASAGAADDAPTTCQQIISATNEQNAIIKQANDDRAQLANARPDPGAADPAIAERLDEIKADKATTRANSLIALGRSRQCFK